MNGAIYGRSHAPNAIRDIYCRFIRESYSAFGILGILTGSTISPVLIFLYLARHVINLRESVWGFRAGDQRCREPGDTEGFPDQQDRSLPGAQSNGGSAGPSMIRILVVPGIHPVIVSRRREPGEARELPAETNHRHSLSPRRCAEGIRGWTVGGKRGVKPKRSPAIEERPDPIHGRAGTSSKRQKWCDYFSTVWIFIHISLSSEGMS